MHIGIPSSLAAMGLQGYNISQVATRTPAAYPSGESVVPLATAMDNRIEALVPGRAVDIDLKQNVPTDSPLQTFLKADTSKYASNSRTSDPNVYNVYINPNADRSYLAHELGHVVSDQTKVGHAVRNARANPALSRSLGAAALLGAGGSAALTEGDDDLATSIALAYAGSIPKIADEFLATKNGLAIMNDAGMRATAGQRGRMAGGLVTYLAGPLLLGATANLVGNQFDEEPRSTGEIQPT